MGGGGLLDQAEIRLTQPQVELEAWAELGKNHLYVLFEFSKKGQENLCMDSSRPN